MGRSVRTCNAHSYVLPLRKSSLFCHIGWCLLVNEPVIFPTPSREITKCSSANLPCPSFYLIAITFSQANETFSQKSGTISQTKPFEFFFEAIIYDQVEHANSQWCYPMAAHYVVIIIPTSLLTHVNATNDNVARYEFHVPLIFDASRR